MLFVPPSWLGSNAKKRLDTLLLTHRTISVAAGCLAVVLPHLFIYVLMHHEGTRLSLRQNDGGDEQKIAHLAVRFIGALLCGEGWVLHAVRRSEDGRVRRAVVQAHFGAFVLILLALLRAQLTPGGGFNAANWLVILVFAVLSGFYGWFSFVEKPKTFQGLAKAYA